MKIKRFLIFSKDSTTSEHIKGNLLVELANVQLLTGRSANKFYVSYDYNLTKSVFLFEFKVIWKIRNLSNIV